MNYAAIKWADVANGPGVRVSLFVSGCTHRCPGCFNEEAQDFALAEVPVFEKRSGGHMERYRSSFTLDEEISREIGPLFWSRWRTWLYWALSVAISVTSLAVGRIYHPALFFLVFALGFVPTPGTKRSFCRRAARRHLYGVSSWGRIESFFTEEGISIYDLTTGAQTMIYYQSIRQAAETEHYFLLRIKTGYWYTLVSKDCLTPEEQTAFLPFLQGECPKLKVI